VTPDAAVGAATGARCPWSTPYAALAPSWSSGHAPRQASRCARGDGRVQRLHELAGTPGSGSGQPAASRLAATSGRGHALTMRGLRCDYSERAKFCTQNAKVVPTAELRGPRHRHRAARIAARPTRPARRRGMGARSHWSGRTIGCVHHPLPTRSRPRQRRRRRRLDPGRDHHRTPGRRYHPTRRQQMVGQLPDTSYCRAHLVAVFNSGFNMGDITGGYYSHGRTAKPLRTGQASLVINDRGAITIGQWGRDITMNPHTVSVRQNLALIVDHGRAANGHHQRDQRWGQRRQPAAVHLALRHRHRPRRQPHLRGRRSPRGGCGHRDLTRHPPRHGLLRQLVTDRGSGSSTAQAAAHHARSRTPLPGPRPTRLLVPHPALSPVLVASHIRESANPGRHTCQE